MIRAITGVDVVNHPDKMLDSTVSKKALVQGMIAGIYTGKKLSDYLPANRENTYSDFKEARRIINGQFMASDYADYCVAFDTALEKAGYEPAIQSTKQQMPGDNLNARDDWINKLIKLIFGVK